MIGFDGGFTVVGCEVFVVGDFVATGFSAGLVLPAPLEAGFVFESVGSNGVVVGCWTTGVGVGVIKLFQRFEM